MERNTFILICVILLIIACFYYSNSNNSNEIEGFGASSAINNEALQNIASVYNKTKLAISELNVTSKADIVNANIQNANVQTATVTNANIQNLNILPRGIIVAWSGTSAPGGWAICNGQNGTPDLRGRFVLGYGSGRGTQINSVGGLDKVPLNINEIPAHTHNYRGLGGGNRYDGHKGSGGLPENRYHNATTGVAGGSQPHENMPPYRVLAYIMKL